MNKVYDYKIGYRMEGEKNFLDTRIWKHLQYLPEENAKECKELFAQCMCDAAIDLGIPISCDVSVTRRWYGEEIMV